MYMHFYGTRNAKPIIHYTNEDVVFYERVWYVCILRPLARTKIYVVK